VNEINPERPRQPIIVILGPTAIGKTEIAIQLAERLNGEIISADSRLFYRELDVGTAKPSQAERARVPHHLVDVANPDEIWSLAVFQREAKKAITGIQARGKLPFLVGGTGQYLRAVTEAWKIPEVKPNPRLRSALENWAEEIGAQGLHQRLEVLDRLAAENIDYRNVRRTVRALEVIFLSGQRFSERRRREELPYQILQLGLTRPREKLLARIDERIDAMLRSGLIEEVRSLIARGHSPDLPSFSAIGYREMAAHLRGEISLDEAVASMRRNTRQLLRHQASWFKEGDPQIHWFQVSQGTVEEMERTIRDWLTRLVVN
jgi:tRNA dimethylallyltransferase